jgi:hypothetical protein
VFVRVEPWLQAGKYAAALMSQIPRRNGWQAEMIAAYMRWRDPPRQAQDQLRPPSRAFTSGPGYQTTSHDEALDGL